MKKKKEGDSDGRKKAKAQHGSISTYTSVLSETIGL